MAKRCEATADSRTRLGRLNIGMTDSLRRRLVGQHYCSKRVVGPSRSLWDAEQSHCPCLLVLQRQQVSKVVEALELGFVRFQGKRRA